MIDIAHDYTIRVVRCPTCHRRRRCHTFILEDTAYWQCSRLHAWQVKVPTMEQINNLFKDIYAESICQALHSPSPLVDYIK
jgi:hypothetical protein